MKNEQREWMQRRLGFSEEDIQWMRDEMQRCADELGEEEKPRQKKADVIPIDRARRRRAK